MHWLTEVTENKRLNTIQDEGEAAQISVLNLSVDFLSPLHCGFIILYQFLSYKQSITATYYN